MTTDQGSELAMLSNDSPEPKPTPQSKQDTRKGLRRFIVNNPTVAFSSLAGLACTFATFSFTYWVTEQTWMCPSWARGCEVTSNVHWIKQNLGLVQGILTALYGFGLAGLAYTAYGLGEASIWPLLHRQQYTLKELDSYLSASRGSLASLPLSYVTIRSVEALVVMLCITITTITPLAGSTLLGYAYNPRNVTRDYSSNYWIGGGAEIGFRQTNPPAPLPAPVTGALRLYTSWSDNLVIEPMPDLRDFIMDRQNLSVVGDISVHAVRVQKTITCTGRAVKVSDTDSPKIIEAATGMKSGPVQIRVQPKLTVWVDSVRYVNGTRSISTLVFAALNGTIEQGQNTEPTENMKISGDIIGISAVACDVDVQLADDELVIGDGAKEFARVSSLDTLRLPSSVNSSNSGLGGLAVWFGVACTAFGISVNGTQPLFDNDDPLPAAYTLGTIEPDYYWSIDTLHNFINVSSGALATAMPRYWIHDRIHLPSRQKALQLESSRSYLLLIPALLILLMIIVLSCWNWWMHRRGHLPVMRLADVGEMMKSSQTADIWDAAGEDAKKVDEPSTLGKLKVGYGITSDGIVGLGSPRTMSRF